jgi:hypothetical protein
LVCDGMIGTRILILVPGERRIQARQETRKVIAKEYSFNRLKGGHL